MHKRVIIIFRCLLPHFVHKNNMVDLGTGTVGTATTCIDCDEDTQQEGSSSNSREVKEKKQAIG